MLRRLVALGVATLVAAPAQAATWRDLGPDGGLVTAIDGTPADGLFAVGADVVVHRSPGLPTWRPCAVLPAGSVAEAEAPRTTTVALDIATGEPLVATSTGALLRGTTSCDAWHRVAISGPNDGGVQALTRTGSRLVAAMDRGVLVSDDGGATWQRGGAGLALALTPRRIEGGSGGFVASWDDGSGRLSCSTDGAATFRTTAIRGVRRAAIGPAGAIWTASGGVLLHSEDGCSTWHVAPAPAGSSGPFIAGADAGGLWIGDDAGHLWRRAGGTDTPIAGTTHPRAVRSGLDGGDPLLLDEHLARIDGAGATTDDAGLHIYAAPWSARAASDGSVVTVLLDDVVLDDLTTEDALRYAVTTDGGAAWTSRVAPTGTTFDVMPRGNLLATDNLDAQRSTDGGATWHAAGAWLGPFARDPRVVTRLWLTNADYANRVRWSDDDTRTWHGRGRFIDTEALVGLQRVRGRTLLITFNGTGFHRSPDAGRSWRAIPSAGMPIRFGGVDDLDIAGDERGLIAIDEGSLVRLATGARRWVAWGQGLPLFVDQVLLRRSGTVFAIAGHRLWQRPRGARRFVVVQGAPSQPQHLLPTTSGVLVAGVGGLAMLGGV